jgi:hypothetical protein
MFRENKDHLQMELFGTIDEMHPRLKRDLEKSWAKVYYEHVFCHIDESLFAPLYCADNGRPNFPVNILLSLEVIKHLFDYTDEEIIDQYSYNFQVNYAVGINRLGMLPLADRTLYEFRERVFRHALLHPGADDLIFGQFELLLKHFLATTGISSGEQRMDSTFITPNIKRAGRLSLAFDVLVQALRYIPGELRTEQLGKALEPDFRTELLFQTKGTQLKSRLQEMLNLIRELLQIADAHPELKERHGLEVAKRFLKEQTYYDYGDDTYSAKENKDIAANSLQSAYDQDATYRKKGSKQAVGYIENITETCGEDNSVQFITDYRLEQNIASDVATLKERLPEIRDRTGASDLYLDGGFYGEDALEVAEQNSVSLHYTNMTGKESNKIPVTKFEIEDLKTIKLCPGNCVPFRTSCNEEKGILTAHFSLADCKQCPFNKKCRVKLDKKNAVLRIDRKSLLAAREREKLGCKEMRRENTSKRSAIEGTISALKRGRGAGRLRVKGIVKCSLTAGMKVIAQNIRQLVSYFQRSCALFLDNLHRNVQQNQAVRA